MQKMQFKPNLGDTIVTAERDVYICSSVNVVDGSFGGRRAELNWESQTWDRNGGAPSAYARRIQNAYRVVKIISQLSPQVGDTIVTKERGLYTCSEVSPNGSFKGTRNNGYNEWEASGESYGMKTYPESTEAYRAIQIIPKHTTDVESLKFRIRALETENELLTRSLLKVGVL